MTKEQLTRALAAHSQGKVRLKQSIETRTSEFDPVSVGRDDKCDLGAWLHDPTADRQSSHFERTLEAHRRFHRAAADVLRLALDGRTDEARAAMGIAGEFSKASAAVSGELVAWQRELG